MTLQVPNPPQLILSYGRKVFLADIEYLHGLDNYTMIHLTTGEQLLLSKTLMYYERRLAAYGFIRCHKSYLLNTAYITALFKDRVVMQSEACLEISRRNQRRKSEFHLTISTKISLQKYDDRTSNNAP